MGIEPASTAEGTIERHARLGASYVETLSEERPLVDASRAVITPLLIIEGESPSLVSHPRLLYGALRDRGLTVTLVELPARAGGSGPQTRADLFFRQLRWFDQYLKFGGADLFDFYLLAEPVPGPGGWLLRVTRAQPRGPYLAVEPAEQRYLEVVIEYEPSDAATRDGTLEPLQLNLAEDLSLLTPDNTSRSFAGTVTEIFGRETLILGSPSPITVSPPESGAAPKLTFHLAFEIPEGSGEYRLLHEGFGPVRIWVGREP